MESLCSPISLGILEKFLIVHIHGMIPNIRSLPQGGRLLICAQQSMFTLFYSKGKDQWELTVSTTVQSLIIHRCKDVSHLIQIAQFIYYIFKNIGTDTDLLPYMQLQIKAYKLAARLGPYKDTHL